MVAGGEDHGRGQDPIAPRPIREAYRGFSIPFQMLRQGAHHLLRRATSAREESAPPEEKWHWDRYAIATQLFAAMAAEAQLNTYGLVRFGEDYFHREFKMTGPVGRLRAMLKRGSGVILEEDSQPIPMLKGLLALRNEIAHMQADEEVFNRDGHILRPAPPPPDHFANAHKAVGDMESFLAGFAQLVARHDIDNHMVITPW